MTARYNHDMASRPKVQSLEKAALRLDPGARAKLVHTFVDSLGGLSREQVGSLWLDEAERRSTEMEAGKVKGIPGEKVFAELEARYKKKK